ncbi:hypothetical protein K0M31_006591 [Melipona bicolor]|uniref:Uncharacterized protein n=1 Tax=Melipona bicolor TaxID=60889 RepID=A0AA40KL37_9HYME|nr:hypothetical protein K0M31_006591 [Melipona bicolor]
MPIFCRVTGSEARSRRTAIVVPGKNSNLPGSNGGEGKKDAEKDGEKKRWRGEWRKKKKKATEEAGRALV